jgi:membrane-associated phospholipid phosphatase
MRRVIGYWVLALALVGSWLWPVTRAWWDVADEAVFFALNGLLDAPWLAAVMGVANNRFADVVVGLVMVGMLFCWVRAVKGEVRFARVAACGLMVVFALLVMQAQRLAIDVSRLSPSLVLKPVHYLSELVPWAHPKDRSEGSFPGDHAAVLMMFAWFIRHHIGGRSGMFAWALAVAFSLPRLFGGAHWLTDVSIGSVAITLVAMPLVLHAPFMQRLKGWTAGRLARMGALSRLVERL